MRRGAKRITREQLLGETAVQFIGRRFLDMGLPWHPTNAPLDAGIDGFVEVRDHQSGEATNAWVAVQSKGRTTLEKETEVSFEFTCTPRDLDYWRRGNMPVLLVVSRPSTNEAWWVSVKDYFREPSRQQSRRILFDKAANALASATPDRLLQLVQAAGAGTYFRPAPKRERLHTNLLEVTRLPQLIYSANTSLRDPREFREQLRKKMQYPPREWLFDSKRIYSVHDLRDEPWASVCDITTVNPIEATRWASSKDLDERRLFVWMLNECLRSFAGKIGMRYSKSDDALYFKKTADLSPRVKRYRSRQQSAERDVFREYRSKTDPAKIFYYRHVGFEPRFRRFDGRWCLQINPTYLFTSDGEKTHPYNEEYLAKIKSIEGSGAVGGTVVMFAALLRDREGLFADNYPHLGFGNLLDAELEVGIDDKLWAKDDRLKPSDRPLEEAVELSETELKTGGPSLFDGTERRSGGQMRLHFIDEPELEFSGSGRHIDIRHGLTEHGPLDRGLSSAPQTVRVGVVGAAQDVERLRAWVDRCRNGIEAKKSKRTTLFVGFPGFGDGGTLCDFVVDDRLTDVLSGADLRRISGGDDVTFFNASTERYCQGAADLIEKANAGVVLCLLPEEFVRRIDVPAVPEKGPRSRRRRDRDEEVVWHDVFKAEALQLARPVQVVRPATYGGAVHRFTRDGTAVREMQDEATRAWNFFCALYYKAGGIPWRLARESTDLMTCYMGISFYHDPASETLRTSVAQVFNERGEGMVVRGGPAVLDESDNTPHLSPEDSEQLLMQAVEAFRREHRTQPARLVCHKSSYFSKAELDGCGVAVKQLRLDAYDLLSLRPSHTRLYRSHSYPPLRGTALVHSEGCLLYTQGSVDFYRCYPGLYAPRTLDVQLDHAETGELQLLSELLALTKMNWNSTELINLEPITLSAARSVGGILRHVTNQRVTQSRFSFFM